MNQQTREEAEYVPVDIKADKKSDVMKRGTYNRISNTSRVHS